MPGFDSAPNMKNHEIRIERVKITFRGIDQDRTAVAADGAVLDLEVGMRKALAQVVRDVLPPGIPGY